jgi:hypothetical protein
MSRLRFRFQTARRSTGAPAPDTTFAVYSDAAGTVLADVALTVGGSSVAGSQVDTDSLGELEFYGPDGTQTTYVRCPADPDLGVQELTAEQDAFEEVTNTFQASQILKSTGGPGVAPELHFETWDAGTALSGWLLGVDVANNGGGVDFVLAARRDVTGGAFVGTTGDLIYIANNGAGQPTIGLAVTPPDDDYRVQVGASDAIDAMGGLAIRVGPSQTGHPFAVRDSNPAVRFRISSDYHLSDTDGVLLQANGANEQALAIGNNAKSVYYALRFVGNSLRLRYVTGAADVLQVDTDGTVSVYSKLVASTFVELPEQGGDPAAPAADTARLYAKDVGGKTALFARFPTGAAVQVAIEP